MISAKYNVKDCFEDRDNIIHVVLSNESNTNFTVFFIDGCLYYNFVDVFDKYREMPEQYIYHWDFILITWRESGYEPVNTIISLVDGVCVGALTLSSFVPIFNDGVVNKVKILMTVFMPISDVIMINRFANIPIYLTQDVINKTSHFNIKLINEYKSSIINNTGERIA